MFLPKQPTDIFGNQVFLLPIHTNPELAFELNYQKTLDELKLYGTQSNDRTGTGTKRALVAPQFVIDKNFVPLLRGKFVSPKNSLTEMIWILLGKSDNKWLKDNGLNYWDAWVKEDGTFGPIYGAQMRGFANADNTESIDQYLQALNLIKNSPESRRIICSLWNPLQQHLMALEPCHCFYQFLVIGNELHLRVYQRSADSFIGEPYDFMLFYYIKEITAYLTGVNPGNISISFGDYHLYNNHDELIDIYKNNLFLNEKKINFDDNIYIHLKYPERPKEFTKETINNWLNEFYSMNEKIDTNYKINETCYPLIKAPVAV